MLEKYNRASDGRICFVVYNSTLKVSSFYCLLYIVCTTQETPKLCTRGTKSVSGTVLVSVCKLLRYVSALVKPLDFLFKWFQIKL